MIGQIFQGEKCLLPSNSWRMWPRIPKHLVRSVYGKLIQFSSIRIESIYFILPSTTVCVTFITGLVIELGMI